MICAVNIESFAPFGYKCLYVKKTRTYQQVDLCLRMYKRFETMKACTYKKSIHVMILKPNSAKTVRYLSRHQNKLTQFNRDCRTTDAIFLTNHIKIQIFLYFNGSTYNKVSLIKMKRYGIMFIFPGGLLSHNFQLAFFRPNFGHL